MIIPRTYGNSAKAIYNSSNRSSGYISGQQFLSGSNIGTVHPNSGYSNFDQPAEGRMNNATGSIFAGLWGVSRAAFPNQTDWTWRALVT